MSFVGAECRTRERLDAGVSFATGVTLRPESARPALPYLPGSDRRLLEAPVARWRVRRNRVAHHEPLLAEPLPDRYTDLLDVVGFVHPQLRSWLDTHNRLLTTLAQRP